MMTITDSPSITVRTEKQKSAALRRHMLQQLLLELVLPLSAYYLLRGFGVRQWLALVIGGCLLAPWIIYGMIRGGRVQLMPFFTLSLMLLGAVMSAVTGDPRTLLVRDSWVGGLLGLWLLVTIPTQRPFMLSAGRGVVAVKVGEHGANVWCARWATEAVFRKNLRILTGVWGAVFTLDAGIRMWIAYRIPVDSVPLVSTLQWLVILAATIGFHTFFVTKNGLKA